MQTFLPYPNFIGSAKVLDVRRLGKQRVENLQIMQCLLNKRVVNTGRFEPTGEFRTVFYDPEGNEISTDMLDVFDSWTQAEKPVMRIVATDQSEWRLEDYTPAAWHNHPVMTLWRGYEHVLMHYQHAICDEWESRGFKETCRDKTSFLYDGVRPTPIGDMPPWFGDEDFHRSHQSNLLRKHPKYYSQFFYDVPDNLPYLWPVAA